MSLPKNPVFRKPAFTTPGRNMCLFIILFVIALSYTNHVSAESYSEMEDQLEMETLEEYAKRWDFPTAEEDKVENLLLSSLNDAAVPDPMACTDLDPHKYFDVMNIEKKVLRMCDLCPNLPFQKLAGVNFDRSPFVTKNSTNYQDCLATCLSDVSCIAVSFGSGMCNLFDHTEGNLVKVAGQLLIIITQPTGIIRDWIYSRNSVAKFGVNVNVSEAGYFQNGPQIVRSKQDSFLGCLSQCDVSLYCISASYKISDKSCEILLNIGGDSEPEVVVDYKYGHLAALKVNRFTSARNNSWWRFQSPMDIDGRPTEAFRQLFVFEADATSDVRTEFGVIPTLACNISNGPFCTSNETMRCRNPENSGDKEEQLPVCPGSRHEKYLEIKARIDSLQRCFDTCLKNTLCIGVTFSANKTACEIVTLDDTAVFSHPEIFFPLRMPSLNLNSTALKYSIYPGLVFNETGVLNTQAANASSCMELCQKNVLCRRFSYDVSTKQCILADKLVSLRANANGLVFIQVPEISSPKVGFTHLVSSEFVGREALSYFKSAEKLSREMMEKHMDTCLIKCFEYSENRCQFVGVEYEFDVGRATCILYQHGVIFPLDGAVTLKEVYVRNSHGNLNTIFNQENLDLTSFFGTDDFTGCFRLKPEMSLQQLLGFNPEKETIPQDSTNVKTRFAYDREIPTDLTELQKKLKSSIFDILGQSLLDIADQMVPVGKTNNTVDRKPAVVKIWQSANIENVFQEVQILPHDRKFSPFRISKNLAGSEATIGFSSFGTSQSGLVHSLAKVGNNLTEVSGRAALSLYGPSTHLKEYLARLRTQFSSLERLVNANFGFFATGGTKRPRFTEACYNEDKCPVGTQFNKKYKTDAECTRDEVKDVPKFCDMQNCEPLDLGNQLEHTFAVSGAMTPKHPHEAIKENIAYYVVRFTRKTGPGQFLPNFTAHLVDKYNYQRISTLGRPDSRWEQHGCVINTKAETLAPYQYSDKDYVGSHKSPNEERYYDKGHFAPADAIGFLGHKAWLSTYLYVNAAPQAHMINNGCWKSLESKILAAMRKHSLAAIVTTGICEETQPPEINTFGVPIPKCFWKLVCYKEKIGNEWKTYVSGFMHNNWLPIETDKKKQIEPMGQYTLIEKVFNLADDEALLKAQDIWGSVRPALVQSRGDENIPTVAECVSPDAHFGNLIGAKKSKHDCGLKLEGDGSTPVPDDLISATEEFARTLTIGSRPVPQNDENNNLNSRYLYEASDPTEEPLTFNWHAKTEEGDGYFNSTPCHKRLVGYFNAANSKYAFTDVTGLALTHAIYASLSLKDDGSIDTDQLKSGSQPFAEFLLKVNNYEQISSMVSIGDYSRNSSTKFSSMASDSTKRLRFLQSVVSIMNIYFLHGVDINWQQFYLPGSKNKDRENYVTLMRELRQIFDQLEKTDEYNKTMRISIVGPNNIAEINSGLDLPQLLKYVDWINVNLTGNNGQMFPIYPLDSTKENPGRNNSQWVLRYYTCKAKEFGPYKINMGVAFQDLPNTKSVQALQERADYAKELNLGGFSIWSIDKLGKRDYAELRLIRETNLCNIQGHGKNYTCYDSDVIRWAPIGKEAPKCGVKAPTINGHWAVCDPFDPDFGCCGPNGTCGSGLAFCTCPTCVDYYNHPETILD